MIKQLTSNTPYFYCVWGYIFRSLCDHHQAFLRIKSINAGYMLGSQRPLFYPLNFIYLSARYNTLVLIVNMVVIPTCSQHLLTWFARRPDDGHTRTEICSLTHNKNMVCLT